MALSRVTWTLACALGLLAAAGPAHAQEDTPPEAVEFYRQAREHYANGAYQDAADALERSLVLDPDSPTLLYNLARVYELLGELDRSLEFYRRYQTILPQQQAQEQARADATIRRLTGARESARQNDTPVEPPREVEALRQLPGLVLVRENGVADDMFWTILLAGAVSLGTGGVFGTLGLVYRGNADDFVLGQDGDATDRRQLYSDATLFAGIADVTLGIGGAAVIAAGLLYFLRDHTVERAPVRAVERSEDDDRVDADAQGIEGDASEGAGDGNGTGDETWDAGDPESGADGATLMPTGGVGPDGVFLGLRGTF